MKSKQKTILCFFGTRPEAIKMAPVVAALKRRASFKVVIAVSAQHRGMLDQVLKLFRLSSDVDLDVMKPGQSLTDVTVRVIERMEPVLKRVRPDLVLVHGDTTTSLAGAIASFYQHIPVGHVEAGLRTFDLEQPFPEEANRQLTDTLSTLYFCPTSLSEKNLLRERRNRNHIFITGNTVIDALLGVAAKPHTFTDTKVARVLSRWDSSTRSILMTAHRRENFGKPFDEIFKAVHALARRFERVQWVYPVHPNPNVESPARRILAGLANVHLCSPLDYADLVQVMKRSTLVVTDSGGLQEEAPSLGKPVLVLRDVTERPEAVKAGTVRLVGSDSKKIIQAVTRLLTQPAYHSKMANAVNPYGDGHASERIADAIAWYFGLARAKPRAFSPKS
jgi:UDP-N-acetylglucosamine 2-epimerase (non-hydrolysing)